MYEGPKVNLCLIVYLQSYMHHLQKSLVAIPLGFIRLEFNMKVSFIDFGYQ